jgi:hypothetical protein
VRGRYHQSAKGVKGNSRGTPGGLRQRGAGPGQASFGAFRSPQQWIDLVDLRDHPGPGPADIQPRSGLPDGRFHLRLPEEPTRPAIAPRPIGVVPAAPLRGAHPRARHPHRPRPPLDADVGEFWKEFTSRLPPAGDDDVRVVEAEEIARPELPGRRRELWALVNAGSGDAVAACWEAERKDLVGWAAEAWERAARQVGRALSLPVIDRARRSPRVWRELSLWFPDGTHLVERIVDLVFEEDGELAVTDSQSDAITEGQVLTQAARHAPQLQPYGRGLAQAAGRPVRERLVLCTALGRAAPV